MPFSRLADHIIAASSHARHGGGGRVGAAGVIGGVIGSMMDDR
jgi:hypothetical protein